ncbi:MAG: hypothetical protein DCF32_15040 [Leptolyngbya sp.]|nr:MAG: hypothetical protein DCF32_15040 [Leptolyngbya sp.]
MACSANRPAQAECNAALDALHSVEGLDLLNVSALYQRLLQNHEHVKESTVRYWVESWRKKALEGDSPSAPI